MGANVKTRPSAFEEALAMIRALLAGDTVDGGQRFPGIQQAHIDPQPPEPEDIWIGGSVEASIDRAARLGDAWLAGPELTPDAADRFARYYLDRCEAHGRQPTAVAIRRDIYVGESDAEAEATAGSIVRGGYRGFSPDAVTYGGPATVADKFASLARLGYTDVIVRQLSVPQEAALASYAHLAQVRTLLANS
jgi:alkanesulfonate monooxygenase SsuD/methylene tetrahydromethanopterin reductase-like flavin-dependent oxidoreductase (luciferase family)